MAIWGCQTDWRGMGAGIAAVFIVGCSGEVDGAVRTSLSPPDDLALLEMFRE